MHHWSYPLADLLYCTWHFIINIPTPPPPNWCCYLFLNVVYRHKYFTGYAFLGILLGTLVYGFVEPLVVRWTAPKTPFSVEPTL